MSWVWWCLIAGFVFAIAVDCIQVWGIGYPLYWRDEEKQDRDEHDPTEP